MALRHRRNLTVDIVRLCTSSATTGAARTDELGSLVGMLIDVRCDADFMAFARNSVLQESIGDWVVFVDESVELRRRWVDRLGRDLESIHDIELVACSVGAVETVGSWSSPRLPGRPPGLDVAYRRSVLDRSGPFVACAESGWSIDMDMQLRLTSMGFVVQRGERSAR